MSSDDDLPGLRASKDIFAIWQASLGTHADTWGDAWRDIKGAKYSFARWAADLAKVHEANWTAIDKIVRYPVANTINEQIPPWINFDLRGKKVIADEDLTRPNFKTRTYYSNITGTELAPFGASLGRVTMKAERLPSAAAVATRTGRSLPPADEIRVTITGMVANGKKVDLKAPIDASYRGSYLGMVMVEDPTDRSEPPLAIVTLVL